jgi:TonB family protein
MPFEVECSLFVLRETMLRRCIAIEALLVLALLLPQTAASTSATVAVVQTPPKTNAALRNRGIELYRQHQYFEAAKVLLSAVKEDKSDNEAWYYLGLSLVPQPKKAKDAAKAFETAIKLRPKFAAAHSALAYVLLWRNKSSEAFREAQTALSIDPSLPEAHYIIGVVHINLSDPERALSEANEAIKLNREFASAYLLKSQALVSVYAKKAAGSTRFLQTSSPPQTPDEKRASNRKKHMEAAMLLEGAAASLETYLRLNPSDSSAEFWQEQVATLKIYGNHSGSTLNLGDAIFIGDEVTTKARVLMKPEPTYTESAREAQVTGTVMLRAVFAADGSIRHILVLKGLPNGLTEAAIRASQQIKFIPATINGRRVSMFIQLEYNFYLF